MRAVPTRDASARIEERVGTALALCAWRVARCDAAPLPTLRCVEISARGREHVLKHLRRQHAGIGVVARAMVAHEEAQLSDVVRAAMGEWRARTTMVEGRNGGLVGDASERDDGA